MHFSNLRYLVYGILLSVSVSSLVVSAGTADGVFGDYFTNIITNSCQNNSVVTGFDTSSSTYGKTKCSTIQSLLGSLFGLSAPGQPGQAVVGFNSDGTLKYGDVGAFTRVGDNITYTGGNVGIGTTNPTNKLSVAGTANIDGNLTAPNVVYGINSTKTTNISDFNAMLPSGFGDGYNSYGSPYGSTWFHLITNRHVNTDNQYEFQISSDFWQGGKNTYLRTIEGGVTQPWRQVITTEPDGKLNINNLCLNGTCHTSWPTSPEVSCDRDGKIRISDGYMQRCFVGESYDRNVQGGWYSNSSSCPGSWPSCDAGDVESSRRACQRVNTRTRWGDRQFLVQNQITCTKSSRWKTWTIPASNFY